MKRIIIVLLSILLKALGRIDNENYYYSRSSYLESVARDTAKDNPNQYRIHTLRILRIDGSSLKEAQEKYERLRK